MFTGGQITHRQSPKSQCSMSLQGLRRASPVLLARISQLATVSSLMLVSPMKSCRTSCAVVSLATLALELSSVPLVAHFCEKSLLKLYAYSLRIRLADWISTAQSPQLDVADHCLVFVDTITPGYAVGRWYHLGCPHTHSQLPQDSTDLCKASSHNCMRYTINNSHSTALQLQLHSHDR